MKLLYVICLFVWYIIGMYGAVFYIRKRNKQYKRKWKTKQVSDVPIIGVLGLLVWIAGFIILYGPLKNTNEYKINP